VSYLAVSDSETEADATPKDAKDFIRFWNDSKIALIGKYGIFKDASGKAIFVQEKAFPALTQTAMSDVRTSWIGIANTLKSQVNSNSEDKLNAAIKKYDAKASGLLAEMYKLGFTGAKPAPFNIVQKFIDATTTFAIDISSIQWSNYNIESAFMRGLSAALWGVWYGPGVFLGYLKMGYEIVAKILNTTVELAKKLLDAAPGATAGIANIIKWGAVGGAVYLLWTVLKPKKESPAHEET